LTTLEVIFPRFILAEMNTHRVFSRNSASSRAIPPEKLIERVREDPFIPETFNKRVKGMGVGEAIDNQEYARAWWLSARDAAVEAADGLMELDVDKSRVNRLLEPYMWHTAIISSTEWENFFALRDHHSAQPEMQRTAKLMREAIGMSEPESLEYGWWHLPLISGLELHQLCQARKNGMGETAEVHFKEVSVGRVARVSFDTHENFEPVESSVQRTRMLRTSGHFSPFEHIATPASYDAWYGNFRGWVQMRHEIPHQDNFAKLSENVDVVRTPAST
jgi:thymidylate synthase ThyX